MNHAGKAAMAARRIVTVEFAAFLVLSVSWIGFGGDLAGPALRLAVFLGLAALAVVAAAFTLYFFRDPEARVPSGAGLVVSPGHGTVDAIDTTTEPEFIGGECRRVSMFLSVMDVHVQNTPVAGTVALCKHTPGQYLNAMKAESARFNENVLIGFECTDPPGEKVGVRLIAGVLARRIVPWVVAGNAVARGERMSLIQFGSRVDVYLPGRVKVNVKPGDKVVGGETVLATFE